MKKILILLMLVVGGTMYAEDGKKEQILILLEKKNVTSKKNMEKVIILSKELEYKERYEIYMEKKLTKGEIATEAVLNVVPGFGVGSLIKGDNKGFLLTGYDIISAILIYNSYKISGSKKDAYSYIVPGIYVITKAALIGANIDNDLVYNESLKNNLN